MGILGGLFLKRVCNLDIFDVIVGLAIEDVATYIAVTEL